MVASKLLVGLSAVAGSLAAPQSNLAPRAGTPPNFVLDANHPLMLARRNFTNALMGRQSNTNYNQDYTTGGNIQYSPGTNEFSLTYSVSQDFVVGVGWNPGGTV
jgi:endo-1,4-beta-xylanase